MLHAQYFPRAKRSRVKALGTFSFAKWSWVGHKEWHFTGQTQIRHAISEYIYSQHHVAHSVGRDAKR